MFVQSLKRTIFYALFMPVVTLFSCQHELQWETNSSGVLAKNAAGECLSLTVAGNFITNKTVNDSNYIIANVDITGKGNYSITSDSVNGYQFKGSGKFDRTGSNAVKIFCTGTPVAAGTNHFVLRYNNSSCEAYVTVKTDTVAIADFKLQGSPGNCMDDTIYGYYIQSLPLDTSNSIIVKVNVVTPGTFSINTGLVNGYFFSASGSFDNPGVQTVKLHGSGVPAVAGNNSFRLVAGSGSCDFTIVVAPVVAVVNQSYFPLTEGSSWTYTIDASGSTLTRTIRGDSTLNNTKFVRMFETGSSGTSLYLFNQNIYDYTEFARAEKYTSSFSYGSPVNGLLPFLKEHLAFGQSWESEEFKGVASFGQVIFIKYYYKCVDNNAAITINGQGFVNVYHVNVYPQIRSESNAYGSTGEIYNCYYAKGIGLVYLKKTTSGFSGSVPMQIKTWHVN